MPKLYFADPGLRGLCLGSIAPGAFDIIAAFRHDIAGRWRSPW